MTHSALLAEVWGPEYAEDTPGPPCPHRQPAAQDRAPAGPALHPHRPRRRLPLLALIAASTALCVFLTPGRLNLHAALTGPVVLDVVDLASASLWH